MYEDYKHVGAVVPTNTARANKWVIVCLFILFAFVLTILVKRKSRQMQLKRDNLITEMDSRDENTYAYKFLERLENFKYVKKNN